MLHRIFSTTRFFSSTIIVRLSSTNKIPIENLQQIDDDDDDDDYENKLKKQMTTQDYIFADSKSAQFKEKNKRKQKQWIKQLDQRKVLPKTPLSPLIKENKSVRDTYVTPDGTLREDSFQMNFDTDVDENQEEDKEPIPLAVDGRRFPVWYYAGKLQQLASQNKIKETLDYFYNEMMDKERVAPNLFCYQVVIGLCARNGYLTQAFDLYKEMKDRGFTTVDSRKMTKIFTLLATACYRASDSTLAIDRATHFLDEMKIKGFRIEYRTYNALIAAFGKHNQMKMAFQLADEMVEVGFTPNEDTYASLLIACNAEKTAGFKYAIEIWRRMLAFNIKPTPYHFGLLLNTAYQCGLGSPKGLTDLLFPVQPHQYLLKEQEENDDNKKKLPRGPSFLSSIGTDELESSQIISTVDDNENSLAISSNLVQHQNESLSIEWWQDPEDVRKGQLLKNHLRPLSNASILKPGIIYEEPNLVSIRMPKTPAERLMLLGGIPGVIKHMQESNVTPNNIIFNTFLNLLPPLADHEQALIHVSKMCEVKPNIQFYNALILRRLRRGSKEEALQVLDLIRDECLSPDEYTFSALAKTCSNRHDAEQLLNEMTELNLKPNQKILEAMLKTAFYRTNFPLLSLICQSYQTFKLPVNKEFLERTEKFLQDIRTKILAMEHAKINDDQYKLLSSSYDRFQKFYNRWLQEVKYAERFDQKVSFRFDKPDLKK